MPIIDYRNNTIYWDETNVTWLPKVRWNKLRKDYTINKKQVVKTSEEVIDVIKEHYQLKPLSEVPLVDSIYEIAKNTFLVNGHHIYNFKQPSVISVLASAYNMPQNLITKRLNKGMTLEQALTTPIGERLNRVRDHEGNEFKSQQAMCEYWNISKNNFRTRINKGWSLEQALTTPLKRTTNK
ncbi:TPA: hypothetical protein ACGWER_002019 [Streptococcus agalactiae]|nr:hypothetical protein [Streptococcus agalactiae]HEO2267349.1 hypothetical protein [Streptococcus agalactiae]